MNNFDLYLDLNKLLKDTIIRVNYDYSDSDNAFVHSGPRITELSTNPFLTPGTPSRARPASRRASCRCPTSQTNGSGPAWI